MSESGIINENGIMKARSAVNFVTEEDIPDPVGLRMMNQFILVRPVSINNTISSKSGKFQLILPETAKEDQQKLITIGRVIALGDYACKREGVTKLKEGDYVLFPKHAGDRIIINDVKCVIMFDDTPLAVVDIDKISLGVK